MIKNSIERKNNIIGIGLVSGGLDSLIACLLIKLQGIKVIGVHFKSPFCTSENISNAYAISLDLFKKKLGIDIHTLYIKDDYLSIIRNPKYGYGKNLNPCIDCRIYFLKQAKKFQEKEGADFIFTGEVLNQRPKSQHLNALNVVEKESGLEGKLLRPLSALHLKPTIYEKKGLINRSNLLGIKGRSRKKQLELAKKYDLLQEYYASGGCLLTDIHFVSRMQDYLRFNDPLEISSIDILKYGRHFRYKQSKIIIGRNESENKMLLNLKKPADLIMEAKDDVGPITIIQGPTDDEVINYAAMLTLRYSDYSGLVGDVNYGKNYNEFNHTITVKKAPKDIIKMYIL
ncbi:MAG: hypothetical protein ACFFB0_18455 [Promethearchaeota archaeon]